jgi:hypothetical protein
MLLDLPRGCGPLREGGGCMLRRIREETMDQITVKTPNPKGSLFLKIDLYGVYLSEAPSPPRFLFGVVKQFCRFGIWSNTQYVTPGDALHTT